MLWVSVLVPDVALSRECGDQRLLSTILPPPSPRPPGEAAGVARDGDTVQVACAGGSALSANVTV
eukprot:gene7570-7071_t